MKAINCSQCGALIGDISSEKRFAQCNYCGAKLHPTDENIFDIPRKEAVKIIVDFEKTHKSIQPQKLTKNHQRTVVGLLIGSIVLPMIISAILVIGIFAVFYFTPNIKTEVGIQATAENVSFEMKSLNFDKAASPEYSIFDLPTWDEDELKKTVFKERKINVKVKVNDEGKVIEAEALNGHELLRNICKKAALETTFFTPAPSEITLTYLFYVKDVEWINSE